MFTFEGEVKVAKWAKLIELYENERKFSQGLELMSLVSPSKLTEIAVTPKPVERQRVRPCLQVFCDETLSALKTNGNIDDVDGTAIFMSKIIEFWKIVNCHGLYRDTRLRDPNRAAIHTPEDENLKKLLELADFAEQLAPKGTKRENP